LLLQPTGERVLHGLKLTRKKVIGAGKEHQAFGFGGGVEHLRQLCGRREWVVVPTEKQFGGHAVVQKWVLKFAAISLCGQPE
jgi:hypothetical protein